MSTIIYFLIVFEMISYSQRYFEGNKYVKFFWCLFGLTPILSNLMFIFIGYRFLIQLLLDLNVIKYIED